MLKSLYIENVAIIEKASIEFTEGLNVLTGETGAGKSIVIDSINAILGDRISKNIIRTGENSAYITAVFTGINTVAAMKMKEYGFDSDEEEYMIQREISLSGKGICRINGRPVPLAVLKEISEFLINIHGQHESAELRSDEYHIEYIDAFGRLLKEKQKYKEEFENFAIINKKLLSAESDAIKAEREKDLLSFQSGEIEAAALKPGEEEALKERRDILKNADNISESLSEAVFFLSGVDESAGAVSLTDKACSALTKAARYHDGASQLLSRLNDLCYELKDCESELTSSLQGIEADPRELLAVEERLDVIYRLAKKYGGSSDDVLAYYDEINRRLAELETLEFDRGKLSAEFEHILKKAMMAAAVLSEKRKKAAEEFAHRVKAEMEFLDMPSVTLVPEFTECPLYENGTETLRLLISVNPGEAPKPVSKIASGGELSRMMLGIKSVMSEIDETDTLIFDEIDTGISGSAAQKVGLKLKSTSQNRQVICVTHQAQIASLAHTHFKILKKVENGRTFTIVQMLDFTGRKHELARIIGGVNITELTLKHAEEMLTNKNN